MVGVGGVEEDDEISFRDLATEESRKVSEDGPES